MYALGLLALLVSIVSFSTPFPTVYAQDTRPETGWSGAWSTSWTIMKYGEFKTYEFNMTFVQSGSTVTGTSDYYSWSLNGTVSGNTLTGTWSAPDLPPIWDSSQNMYIADPHTAGQFYFTLDQSGRTFTGIFKGQYHWVPDISNPATWDQRFVVRGEKSGYTPTPPPPPPPPPPPSTSKQFTGKWDTDWGGMNLLQVGNTLTGTYDYEGGKIQGTIDGNTATGTWSEAPSYQPPLNAGDFIFILSADGKIISGKWRFGSCDWDGDIRGTRGEQPAPPIPPTPTPTPTPITPTGDWSGTWSSNWGQMTLSQNGNQVTGSYTHDNGKISATVSGNTLLGTWSEAPSYTPPNDAGDMVFTMSADGQSFTGDWKYGSTGNWQKNGWQGTRMSTPKTITVTSTCDWSGTWDFDWSNELKLVQTGNHITGTYIPGGWTYTGTIDGTVSGNAFEGTWAEQDRTGRMQLTISADCNSFTGRYTHSLSSSATWYNLHAPAVRVTSPQSDVTNLDWGGTWNTDWGEMQLSQSGEGVTGTYEYNNGEIEGSASGNVLTGTWSKSPSYAEPNDLGSFEFTMSDDQMSFTGNWKYASCDWNSDWDGTLIEQDVQPQPENHPPIASFLTTPQSPTTSDIVIATSQSSDPDGDTLIYSWSLDGATASQYSNMPYFIWQNPTAGTHTIALLVNDGKGGTNSFQAQITVAQAPQPIPPVPPTPANQIPIASFSITPQSPTTNDTIITTNTSTDPDGDSLTYSWLRDGTQTNECNNMPYCAWTNPTAGIHTIRLQVNDGKGGTSAVQTQVNVTQAQPQPAPGPIPGVNNPPKAYFVIEPPQPEAGDSIKIVSQSTDADGDKLGFTWYLDGQLLGEYADSASWKWKKPQAGGHVIRLLVDDSRGGEDSYSKKIKIIGGDTDDSGGFPEITITIPQCFIATAAYGSPTAEELDTLRAFRDKVLLQSEAGTAIVKFYYQVSPPAAAYIASHEEVRTVVRELLLDPAVNVLKQTQSYWNTDTNVGTGL